MSWSGWPRTALRHCLRRRFQAPGQWSSCLTCPHLSPSVRATDDAVSRSCHLARSSPLPCSLARRTAVALLSHHWWSPNKRSAQLSQVHVIDILLRRPRSRSTQAGTGRLAVDGVLIVDPDNLASKRPDPRHRRACCCRKAPPARGARRLRLSRPRCLTPARPGPNFGPDRLAQSVEQLTFNQRPRVRVPQRSPSRSIAWTTFLGLPVCRDARWGIGRLPESAAARLCRSSALRRVAMPPGRGRGRGHGRGRGCGWPRADSYHAWPRQEFCDVGPPI